MLFGRVGAPVFELEILQCCSPVPRSCVQFDIVLSTHFDRYGAPVFDSSSSPHLLRVLVFWAERGPFVWPRLRRAHPAGPSLPCGGVWEESGSGPDSVPLGSASGFEVPARTNKTPRLKDSRLKDSRFKYNVCCVG